MCAGVCIYQLFALHVYFTNFQPHFNSNSNFNPNHQSDLYTDHTLHIKPYHWADDIGSNTDSNSRTHLVSTPSS